MSIEMDDITTWNYRILKRGEDYGIYEVYYDQAGIPKVKSVEPIAPAAESLEELSNCLDLFFEALHKDVLEYETLRPMG